MERGNEWSVRVTRGIGKRVAYHRARADLTAAMLSTRCGELGLPVDRNVIAKLENGHRNSVTVDEVYVLAAALRVAPLLLLFGVGTEETSEFLPGQYAAPFRAALWASGEEPVPGPDDADVSTVSEFASTTAPLGLYRAYVHAIRDETRAVMHAQVLDHQAAAESDPDRRAATAGAAAALRQASASAGAEVADLRGRADEMGIMPPGPVAILRRPQPGNRTGEDEERS